MKTFFKNPSNRFFVLSLFLHAAFIITLLFWSSSKPQTQVITMEIIEAPPAAPPASAVTQNDENKKAPKKTRDELNKIVDQDEKPVNNDIDKDTRFLSKHNQRVVKQTVAQNRGEFKNRAKAGEAGKEGSEDAPENPMKRFLPQFDVAQAVDKRDEREKAYDADAERLMAVKIQKKKEAGAINNAQKGKGQDATAGSDVSQTLDYIKDLDPGLETMLSSKEFKFYTYFSRIRVQLNHHWAPTVRQKVTKIYKQGRSIASTEDMITRCLITLDTNGKLIKVQIIGKSGVIELDEAATEAFRSAAPFPNPPKGMIDQDGTIKIRWDFILEA